MTTAYPLHVDFSFIPKWFAARRTAIRKWVVDAVLETKEGQAMMKDSAIEALESYMCSRQFSRDIKDAIADNIDLDNYCTAREVDEKIEDFVDAEGVGDVVNEMLGDVDTPLGESLGDLSDAITKLKARIAELEAAAKGI